MRSNWEALHESLERSVRTLKADEAFQKARRHCPRLAEFDEPQKLVAHLTSPSRDLDGKDAILGSLVSLVQRRFQHEVSSALLWLGLWPGLDAVFRRRLRYFREQPDELVAELAFSFTALVERLDLTSVNRVAATLVRSTERDVMAGRKSRWAEDSQSVQLPSDVSWRDLASTRHWEGKGLAFTCPSFEEDTPILRAWLVSILGDDADLLLSVLVLEETQREAGMRLGITHEAARKRFQRAVRRFREHLATSLSHSGSAGCVCPPRNG